MNFSLIIGTTGSHVPHKSLDQVRATFMPDADNPDRLLSTLLIGNNLANTAASAAGTALAIEFAPGHPVLAATIAVTVILLLFAEITPKVLAASFAEPVVLAVAQPLDHIARVATPLIKILSLAPGRCSGFSGGRQQRDETISEDIKTMAVLGREEGTIGKDEQEMIHSVVESGALSAGQFMVSRIDIMSLDLDLPREEAINLVIESGHSPIPVYRGSKDHIDGVLQARDYLVAWRRGKAGIEPDAVLVAQPISGVDLALRALGCHRR